MDPKMRVAGGGLRDLVNLINVHGLSNMSTGYPEERTRLDDHPVRSTSQRNIDLKYLRRCRRARLTHESVNGFVNNYCYIMSDEENCLECGRRQKRVMGEMLERQFLPWIRDNLIDCLDEDRWPPEDDFVQGTGWSPAGQLPEGTLGFLLAGDHPVLPSHLGNAKMGGQANDKVNTRFFVNTQPCFHFLVNTRFSSSFVNKTLFSIFNNNSVCVHGLPRSIGAFQTLLSFVTFGLTVSGFS